MPNIHTSSVGMFTNNNCMLSSFSPGPVVSVYLYENNFSAYLNVCTVPEICKRRPRARCRVFQLIQTTSDVLVTVYASRMVSEHRSGQKSP